MTCYLLVNIQLGFNPVWSTKGYKSALATNLMWVPSLLTWQLKVTSSKLTLALGNLLSHNSFLHLAASGADKTNLEHEVLNDFDVFHVRTRHFPALKAGSVSSYPTSHLAPNYAMCKEISFVGRTVPSTITFYKHGLRDKNICIFITCLFSDPRFLYRACCRVLYWSASSSSVHGYKQTGLNPG